MQVVLQFPFADFRPFLAVETARLDHPRWPFPAPGREFVRQSGVVRQRRRGGLSQWSGEEFYSQAARAVRFREDPRRVVVSGVPLLGNRGVSRRFHVLEALARFELALEAQVPASAAPPHLFSALFGLRVGVPGDDGGVRGTRLGDAAPALAHHYLRATTRRQDGVRAPVERWWLEPGQPLCVVAHRQGELRYDSLSLRPARPVECTGGKVRFAWFEERRRLFGAWFVECQNPAADTTRKLRLHLLRLHAERECLKRVLAALGTRLQFVAGSDASDRLEEHLDAALRLLDRKTRFGIEQSPLLDAVRDSFALAQPGETGVLTTELEKARKRVARKTERFLLGRVNQASVVNIVHGTQTIGRIDMRSINFGDNVTVTGDFNVVVADQIENSFNRVAASDVKQELKDALQQLAIESAKVAKALPAERAEEVARDLDTLTKEATATQPRRRWYEVSAEGLLDAAKAVGEAAKPLVETVKLVLALLA